MMINSLYDRIRCVNLVTLTGLYNQKGIKHHSLAFKSTGR
jgi:hypothetical protein